MHETLAGVVVAVLGLKCRALGFAAKLPVHASCPASSLSFTICWRDFIIENYHAPQAKYGLLNHLCYVIMQCTTLLPAKP